MKKFIGYFALSSMFLTGCSVFSEAGTAKNLPANSRILPGYASPSAKAEVEPESGYVGGLNNYEFLNDGQVVADPYAAKAAPLNWQINDEVATRATLEIPAAHMVNYYNQTPGSYPLLNFPLTLIIPERPSENLQSPEQLISQPIGLNPSPYTLKTLQADNLQQALENAALLDNRKMVHSLSSPEVLKTRAEYLRVASDGLKIMYQNNPALQAKFESAVAFGIFELQNFNALLYVAGYGKGVIFDNSNKNVIYVNTYRSGTGPGIGYESMYIIFVFKSQIALNQFIGAGGSGGDIGASATLGVVGQQISFNPSISVYQLYRNGFDVQANWGGTVYLPASGLNDN